MAPLLYYIKLCASFQIHQWIQTGVTNLDIWCMTVKNNRAPFLYYIILCALFRSHWYIQTGVTVRKRSIRVKIGDFLSRVTWNMNGWPCKNNRAPLLYYVKLCASFRIHLWSRTWVTVRKRSIWIKIGDFVSHVTLKPDGWHWKTKGPLIYTTLSFVQHFKAIGILKLELQPGDAQFGSKLAISGPAWPWKLTDDLEKQYSTSPMLLQALCIIP